MGNLTSFQPTFHYEPHEAADTLPDNRMRRDRDNRGECPDCGTPVKKRRWLRGPKILHTVCPVCTDDSIPGTEIAVNGSDSESTVSPLDLESGGGVNGRCPFRKHWNYYALLTLLVLVATLGFSGQYFFSHRHTASLDTSSQDAASQDTTRTSVHEAGQIVSVLGRKNRTGRTWVQLFHQFGFAHLVHLPNCPSGKVCHGFSYTFQYAEVPTVVPSFDVSRNGVVAIGTSSRITVLKATETAFCIVPVAGGHIHRKTHGKLEISKDGKSLIAHGFPYLEGSTPMKEEMIFEIGTACLAEQGESS